MKIGITGLSGRVGNVLLSRNFTWDAVDVTNAHEYDVIVHTLAYTDVDGAEYEVSECLQSNAVYTQNLRACTDAKIIYLSTDFVFDGEFGPYDELAMPNPLSWYGQSKLLGEFALWDTDVVVRTTVLYDSHKTDFVTWVLENLKRSGRVTVSQEFITSPTNVYHLAEALEWLTASDLEGIINVACMNALSRYKFATLIALFAGYDSSCVIPTDETHYGLAERPVRAGLDTNLARKLGVPIYSVVDGIKRMSEESLLWKSRL